SEASVSAWSESPDMFRPGLIAAERRDRVRMRSHQGRGTRETTYALRAIWARNPRGAQSEPPPSNRPFPPGPGRPTPWHRVHSVVLLSPTRDNVMSGCNRDEVIRPHLFPTTKSRRSAGTRRG